MFSLTWSAYSQRPCCIGSRRVETLHFARAPRQTGCGATGAPWSLWQQGAQPGVGGRAQGAVGGGHATDRVLPGWRPGARLSQSPPGELAPGSTQHLQEPLGWKQLPMLSWPQGVLNTRLFYCWCKAIAQCRHMWRQIFLQRVGPDLTSLNASVSDDTLRIFY